MAGLTQMDKYAVWATMEALPGKEDQVRAFLSEAASRLRGEPGTTSFTALELDGGTFAILNTFVDDEALNAHVSGEVAQWVQALREELFVAPYAITRARVIAKKGAE